MGTRQAVPGGGAVWGGEERKAGVGARSALRHQTRGNLFERSAGTARSEFCRATPD